MSGGPGSVSRVVIDGVAHLTIEQPAKLNALTFAMRDQLVAHVRAAGADPAVGAVVVQGAGGVFSSGVDLDDRPERQDPAAHDRFTDRAEMAAASSAWSALWHLPTPVVVKAERYCVGWGLEIALHADIVVSTPDCRFFFPSVRNGSGLPDSAMVVHHVGPQWAKRLLLAGETVDGVTAERIGLVSQVVPAAEIDEAVLGLARRMARLPAAQLRHAKAVVNRAVELAGRAGLQEFAMDANAAIRTDPAAAAFSRSLRDQGRSAAIAEVSSEATHTSGPGTGVH